MARQLTAVFTQEIQNVGHLRVPDFACDLATSDGEIVQR